MKTIRGIAFDLEGTVINVEPAHHDAHLQIARELGLGLNLRDCLRGEVLPHFIGGPDEEVYQEMLQLAGNPEGITVAALLERKRRLYRMNLMRLVIQPRIYWGRVFKAAVDLDLKQSIGSLTSKEEAAVLLMRSELVLLFLPDCMILKEDVDHPKPAPDVFLKTAERMGIHPSEQLVFEDSPRGVQAALAAGSVAVGMPVYDLPEVHKALRDAGALRTFNSWEDVDLESLVDSIERHT